MRNRVPADQTARGSPARGIEISAMRRIRLIGFGQSRHSLQDRHERERSPVSLRAILPAIS